MTPNSTKTWREGGKDHQIQSNQIENEGRKKIDSQNTHIVMNTKLNPLLK
jgi:hypothetical protein